MRSFPAFDHDGGTLTFTPTGGGTHVDWALQLSESLLARVHYIVRSPDRPPADIDLSELENRLVKATRAWNDDLRAALIDSRSEPMVASTAVMSGRNANRLLPPSVPWDSSHRLRWSKR